MVVNGYLKKINSTLQLRCRTTIMLKQKSCFSRSLKRNCFFLFCQGEIFSTDLTLICKTLLQLIVCFFMNALRVTTVAVKKLVCYVEVCLCFFKAFTFVNVLNATSSKQRKHITVVILVKPGSAFLRNKEIQ